MQILSDVLDMMQMALASSLLNGDQSQEAANLASSNVSGKEGLFTSEPFQNSSGTFGLPLTNLAR